MTMENLGNIVPSLMQISYNFQRQNGMKAQDAGKLFTRPILREEIYQKLKKGK